MIVMEKKPNSMEAEAYRTLRSNIEYCSFDEKYRVITVTSALPKEGKSTTAGNLALSLSNTNKKVLLVDCDMRKPSIHKKFGISNEKGIVELLSENKTMEDVLHKYNEKLDILPAGTTPPNPSEMLSSNRMDHFVKEMKNHYDYVILDTPPIQVVSDAQILSTKSDGTLLVIKSSTTKKEEVASAVDLINKVNGKIMGTVLNGVNDKKKKYNYYGYK